MLSSDKYKHTWVTETSNRKEHGHHPRKSPRAPSQSAATLTLEATADVMLFTRDAPACSRVSHKSNP